MLIEPSAWAWALLGGALIGISSSILLLFTGRIAGISGILAKLSFAEAWRVSFIVGLLIAGGLSSLFMPSAFANPNVNQPLLVVAGLLVGFGTRLGGGCTSGHGVCGIPRGSERSIFATLIFIGVGMLTVVLLRAVGTVV